MSMYDIYYMHGDSLSSFPASVRLTQTSPNYSSSNDIRWPHTHNQAAQSDLLQG